MATDDVMGAVCDRLVGGMMFHSDHADLCRWLGVGWLADMHEEGYAHDSACLRRMRRLCVDHVGKIAPEGRQERSHLLDAYRGERSWCVKPDVRAEAVRSAMCDWIDWEDGTVTVLTSACKRLSDCGELLLSDKVRKVVRDTSKELAGARTAMARMDATGWDMSFVLGGDVR